MNKQENRSLDLSYLNINLGAQVHYQMEVCKLVEEAIKHEEGVLSETGALAADTGTFTGNCLSKYFCE